jgi:hypothetical protein
MQTDYSLPRPQQPITGPYPEPDESSPHLTQNEAHVRISRFRNQIIFLLAVRLASYREMAFVRLMNRCFAAGRVNCTHATDAAASPGCITFSPTTMNRKTGVPRPQLCGEHRYMWWRGGEGGGGRRTVASTILKTIFNRRLSVQSTFSYSSLSVTNSMDQCPLSGSESFS